MSEKCFFRLIMVAAMFCSIAGVGIAWKIGNANHGGRGGAIATAIALLALFGTRSYSQDVYDALTKQSAKITTKIFKLTKGTLSTTPKLASADDKLNALEARFKLESEGQSNQNFCLAVATGFGTIFWGFGDMFTAWLL
jgi:hypothetical protein